MKKYFILFLLSLLCFSPFIAHAGCWKFWKRKPPEPPSTDILTELNEESTKVESTITAYPSRFRYYNEIPLMSEYLENDLAEEEQLSSHHLGVGASYYWSQYVPRTTRDNKKHPSGDGKFIIGCVIKVKNRGRYTAWYHRIHWNSGARDKKLDAETIKQIFTELYEGPPETVIPELQDRMNKLSGDALSKELNEFVIPFIDNEGIERVKQTVKKIVQERGSPVASETSH